MQTLKIKGNIWIENNKGHLIGPGRKKLLELIKETGSIRKAAKSMNMSYRHAWEMINNMNKVSSKPIVEKYIGGSNGGGTRLTKDGIKLIETYENLYQAFSNFKVKMKSKI